MIKFIKCESKPFLNEHDSTNMSVKWYGSVVDITESYNSNIALEKKNRRTNTIK